MNSTRQPEMPKRPHSARRYRIPGDRLARWSIAGFLLGLVVIASTWGASAEASGASSGTAPLVRRIVQEMVRTQVPQLLLAALQWTLLGVLLGLAAGVLGILVARALGAYRSGWKYAGWIRWPLWLLTVAACLICAGLWGFWKGVVQGGEQVVRKSQLATEVFPEIGNAVADGVAALQVLLAETNATEPSKGNVTNRVAEFRAGTWEVNAPEFVRQLDRVESTTVSNLVAALEREAVARTPMLRTGLPNQALHQVLSAFGSAVLQKKLDSELKRLGVDTAYHALRDQLVSEAARQGDPHTIGRHEISAFIVNEAIIPAIMKPIRSFAGGQATLMLVLALVCAVVPPLGFTLTCGRVKPPQQPITPDLNRSRVAQAPHQSTGN